MAIQFPNNPGIGSVFTDTDAGFSYEWTGVVWKSFSAAAASNIRTLDDISSSFDNSTTTFNLTIASASYSPQNAAMLQISLGGVIQEPDTDYTVSFDTITFTTAPNAGLDFFGVVRATATKIDFANDGNVQTKQEFTATLGQTSFTVTGGYTQGYVDVFRNGVRLGSDDFTDTSETAIVLTVPAQADDLIEVVKYNVASLVVSQGQFTNLNISGVTTVGVLTGATSIQSGVFYGPLTGNVTGDVTGDVTGTADLASGLTGTPDITVNNITGAALTATSAQFTGNVTIGGTLTYQDVTNIDSVGIITAQQGIQVLANGLDITGIGTFEDRLTYDGSLGQSGGAQVDYAVTVASKDSTHRYNGSGSSNGYVIDNLQAPVLTLTPGRTYFFDQSDSTNSGHPLRFYLEADKTTQYTTNVTAGSISAGTAGAGVTIVIGDSTPNVLHYQCSSHGYMGNSAINQSNIAGGLTGTPDIDCGTGSFTGDVDIADKIIHTGDTDTAIRFPAANTFTAETAGSERLRITSSGRVVVGNDTERNNYDNGSVTSNLLHVERTAASGNAGISICANAETAADAGAIIYMGRTSATSNGGNTIVENNDLIGRISFQGADGSELVEAASIIVDVDGAPGSNDMPGRIEFHTTADGAAGATERVRITSSGNMGVGENSPQQRLHVSSTSSTYIQVQNTGNSVNAYYGVDTGGAWAGSSTTHPFKLHTNNTERLRITAGGGFHFTNGELIERAKVTAGKLSDNTNIDLENGMVHLFTTTETTTSTPNIRINSSTSLNSVMATGEMISVTLITTAAAAAYSAQLTIDGGAVTENWTGGSAPDTGGSSGVDIHAYTIIKTGDAAFTVVATHTMTS